MPVTLASAAWAVAVLSLAAFAPVASAPAGVASAPAADAFCRPAPAADTFAVMCSVKSNVSRQTGERKSSNARQFSSIIHACKRLRQAKNAVLKHPAPFVLLLENKPCEQPL